MSVTPMPLDPVTARVREFNKRYFILNENGKTCIYEPHCDPILKRRVYVRMTFSDFEKLYMNEFVVVGQTARGRDKLRNAATVWLTHPDRRQYIGGITFDPTGQTRPDMFNLWGGFAVEPRAGSWDRLKEHIRQVICNRDDAHYAYLINWMADLVQHPGKQGEVAVVLRGDEGCGKGTLARAVMALFGQHALAISNPKHLTGAFNAHLRDVCFLFSDEAFYAGDKAGISVLKSIITEPTLTIEGKFQTAHQMPNFLHVMMASNAQWVVPASLDSRRWFVLDVPGTKIHERAWFADIDAELQNGGYEAMLYELLHRDLTRANLREVPVTDALQDQRKQSLDAITSWWLDCLHRGYVYQSTLGLEHHFAKWHDWVATELLFASYTRYCEKKHERHPLSREFFGRWMSDKTGGNPGRARNGVTGEHMVDAPTGQFTHRVAETITGTQPPGYSFGKLDEARELFAKATRLTIDWDDQPDVQ